MSKMFFGGKPTKPDVDKLKAAFEPLKVGDQVLHEKVEQVLELPRTSTRYQTVFAKWRDGLSKPEINLILRPDRNGPGGFIVSTDAERIDDGAKGAKHGIRKVLRSAKHAAGVQTQDPILQQKNKTLQTLAIQLAKEAGAGLRLIAHPNIVALNPRRLPPSMPDNDEKSGSSNK